ncbi:hypothetical protein OGATHE_003291 [Ogataea polymorpha]|uniref:Uncharacterized protein n=1 Tax=Ogataea polymorpha TaxID=460523 RepID=A0A9P8T449_9ASCO|nr:hypothetical protein OGATHE_003291 [Ogataea polymorpha]
MNVSVVKSDGSSVSEMACSIALVLAITTEAWRFKSSRLMLCFSNISWLSSSSPSSNNVLMKSLDPKSVSSSPSRSSFSSLKTDFLLDSFETIFSELFESRSEANSASLRYLSIRYDLDGSSLKISSEAVSEGFPMALVISSFFSVKSILRPLTRSQ